MGERRAGDPPQLVAANRRLVERLGWTPKHDAIEHIIGTALAWERRLAGQE
jgi:UDP-glucose 4-epimerase